MAIHNLRYIILIYELVIARFRVQYGNIFRVSHILMTYFTSLYASEIKAKYVKRGKYQPYCAR